MNQRKFFYWLVMAAVLVFSLVAFLSCDETEVSQRSELPNGGSGVGDVARFDTVFLKKFDILTGKRIITRTPEKEPTLITYTDSLRNYLQYVWAYKNETKTFDTVIYSKSIANIQIPKKRIIFRKNLEFDKPKVTKVSSASDVNGFTYVFDYDGTKNVFKTLSSGETFIAKNISLELPSLKWDTLIAKAVNPTEIGDTIIRSKTYHMHLTKFNYDGFLSDKTLENFNAFMVICISDDGTVPDEPEDDPNVVTLEGFKGRVNRVVGITADSVWSRDYWTWTITQVMNDGTLNSVTHEQTLKSKIIVPKLEDIEVSSWDFYASGEDITAYTNDKASAYTIINGNTVVNSGKILFQLSREPALYECNNLSLKLQSGWYTSVKYTGTKIGAEIPKKDGMEGRLVEHNFITEYTDKAQPQTFSLPQNAYLKLNSGGDKSLIGVEAIDTAIVYKEDDYFVVGKIVRKLKDGTKDTVKIDYNLGARFETKPLYRVIQSSKLVTMSDALLPKVDKTTFKDGYIRGMNVTTTFTNKFYGGLWSNELKTYTKADLFYYEDGFAAKLPSGIWNSNYVDNTQKEAISEGSYNVYPTDLNFSLTYCNDDKKFSPKQPVEVAVSKTDDKLKLTGLVGANKRIIKENGKFYSVCDATWSYSDGTTKDAELKYDLQAKCEFQDEFRVEQESSKVNLSATPNPKDTSAPYKDGKYTALSVTRLLESVFGKWSVQIKAYGLKELVYQEDGFSIEMLSNEWSSEYNPNYTQAETPTVEGNFNVYATILKFIMSYGEFKEDGAQNVKIAVNKNGEIGDRVQTGLVVNNQTIVLTTENKLVLNGTITRTFDKGDPETEALVVDLGATYKLMDKFRADQEKAKVLLSETVKPTTSFTDFSENVGKGIVVGKVCEKVFPYKYNAGSWGNQVTSSYRTVMTYSEGQFSANLINGAWASRYVDASEGIAYTEQDNDIYPNNLNMVMTYDGHNFNASQPVEIVVKNPDRITDVTGENFRLYQQGNRWISEFVAVTEHSKSPTTRETITRDLNVSVTNQPVFRVYQDNKEVVYNDVSVNESERAINSGNFTGRTVQKIYTFGFDNGLWSNQITACADEPIYNKEGFSVKMLSDVVTVAYVNASSSGNGILINTPTADYLRYLTTLNYDAAYNGVKIETTQDVNIDVEKVIDPTDPSYGPVDGSKIGMCAETTIYQADRAITTRCVSSFFEKGMLLRIWEGGTFEKYFFAYADGFIDPKAYYGSAVRNSSNSGWLGGYINALGKDFSKTGYVSGWEYVEGIASGATVSTLGSGIVTQKNLPNPILSTNVSYSSKNGVLTIVLSDGTIIRDK